MWRCISASNSIHSLSSWLRSTSLDSAFPSLGCLGETFHFALRLHSLSYPEKIQARMQKMQLQGHATTKLFTTFNQIRDHHCIVVSSMISKKSFRNQLKKLAKHFSPNQTFVPSALQMPTLFLFLASQIYHR